MTCNCKRLPVLSHLCAGSQVISRRTLPVCRFEATAHHLLPALLRQVPVLQRTSLCLGFRELYWQNPAIDLCFSYPHEVWRPYSSPRQALSQASSLTILVLVSLPAVVMGLTHSVHPSLPSTLPLDPTPEPCA